MNHGHLADTAVHGKYGSQAFSVLATPTLAVAGLPSACGGESRREKRPVKVCAKNRGLAPTGRCPRKIIVIQVHLYKKIRGTYCSTAVRVK